MKKTIAVILVILMLALAITGCASQADTAVKTQDQPAVQTALPTIEPTPTAEPTPTPSPSPSPPPVAIKFKDRVVEKVIRTTLDKPEGPVTDQDMLEITSFQYDPVNDKSASGTIKKLDDLRYCVNLDTLHVLHQPVKSIECLRELDKIMDVCILGCSVSDLSPLAGKNSLRKIWISGNPVKDASPVLSLPDLQEFNAYYGTGIKDISSLSDSGNMKYFYCPNRLKDYTPILRQENLQGVVLSGISDEFFRDLISNCTILESICLDHSRIKDESLALLKGRLMYNLYLENCGIKDISALAGLAGVTDLRLGNNKIREISALKGLTDISYCLDLRNNKIKDFSPLESIQMENLWVMGNPYTKASKKVLNKLEENGCRVYR